MINLSRYSHINVTPHKDPRQEIKGIGGEHYGYVDSMKPTKAIAIMDVDVTPELISSLQASPAEEIYYKHEVYYALSHEQPKDGKIPYIIMGKARDLSVEEKLDEAAGGEPDRNMQSDVLGRDPQVGLQRAAAEQPQLPGVGAATSVRPVRVDERRPAAAKDRGEEEERVHHGQADLFEHDDGRGEAR